MDPTRTLSARDALNIAAQYGFSIRNSNWEKQMIRDGILQARFRTHALRHFDRYIAKVAADVKEDSKTYGVPVRRLGLIG